MTTERKKSMRAFKTIIAAAAFSAAGTSVAALADDHAEPTKGEVKLAKMLEGRVAGEPESCIPTFPRVRLTVIDDTALVYKRGNTLWVNIPSNAKYIDDRDTLVTRNTNTRLCKTDIVRTVDSRSGHPRGTINLTDFIPYRKAD